LRGSAIVLAVGLLAMKAGPASAAEAEADVRAVINRVTDGFATYNAGEIASCYTDDALWQNPFGVRLKGAPQIKKFLTVLFQRSGYRSGKDTSAPVIQNIRMLGPDAAVVWSEESSSGQVENGKPIGDRHSHYLEVLHRTAKGWLITDDMIMDERAI